MTICTTYHSNNASGIFASDTRTQVCKGNICMISSTHMSIWSHCISYRCCSSFVQVYDESTLETFCINFDSSSILSSSYHFIFYHIHLLDKLFLHFQLTIYKDINMYLLAHIFFANPSVFPLKIHTHTYTHACTHTHTLLNDLLKSKNIVGRIIIWHVLFICPTFILSVRILPNSFPDTLNKQTSLNSLFAL